MSADRRRSTRSAHSEPYTAQTNQNPRKKGVQDYFGDSKILQEGRRTTKKNENAVHRVKIISLGNAKTGKTCIIKRHCEGRFVSKYLPTIGIDYGVKVEQVSIDGKEMLELRVNFFDFAGDPDYFDVRCEFYEDVSGAFLVYDCNDRATFGHLGKWIDEMKKHGADPSLTPTMLCANKIDKSSRQVKESEGMEFASAYGLTYFEMSCESGEGVTTMFETLLKMIAKRPPVSAWR